MRRRELLKSLPPGPRLPRAWQLLGMWKRPGTATMRMKQRYGSRVTAQLPFTPPLVLLSDPEEIKQLFQAPPDVIHPGEGAGILEPLVGSYSLILLDEDPHLEHRRLLLPAFHGEKMRDLFGLMSELTERELDTWPVDEPVALHPRLQRLTLEIILRAVFGLSQGPRLDELRETVTQMLVLAESPTSVMLPTFERYMPWLPSMRRLNRLRTRADQLIYAEVAERRAALDGADAGAADRDAAPDILSMLLAARHEDGSPMSDRELRDELMTALVAGHETTASQLSWAFMHLAREPRVLGEVLDELRSGSGDAYLTATVQEILRLRPVLPNAEPRLVMREVTIGDFTYPPGVALLASGYMVHHDAAIYPDPYAFRPERFLGVVPGTYTWIPFGGGRRRCLGASFAIQEMKIVIAAVIRRFALEPGLPRPERARRRSITFSPEHGATVILRTRNPKSGYELEHERTGTDQTLRSLSAAAHGAGDSVRHDQEVQQR